jgi:hypothetical protein
MTTTILAWHSDPALKEQAVTRMRAHAAADRLIRASYLRAGAHYDFDWRGCLHGCLVAEDIAAERGISVPALKEGSISWLEETEYRWGIPVNVGVDIEYVYEKSALEPGPIAVSILEAIPVGADLGAIQALTHHVVNLAHGGVLSDDQAHKEMLRVLASAPIPEAVTR